MEGSSHKKVLTPKARREAAEHMRTGFGLSYRRACTLTALHRNTVRYQKHPDRDAELRKRMKELAEERRRFGCRRLHILLKREGLVINHKRTERIYREERLFLRIRRRKKIAAAGRVMAQPAERPNQQWAMDFMYDTLCTGRRIRILNIMDTYTRECLRIEVNTSIGGHRVAEILNQIVSFRGTPERIVIDNGPEFISNALDAWAHIRKITLHFIRPGKPVDNTYIESFNGRFRDECLNENWFMTIEQAQKIIEAWRLDYNMTRPHSSLKDLAPVEFAQREKENLLTC